MDKIRIWIQNSKNSKLDPDPDKSFRIRNTE